MLVNSSLDPFISVPKPDPIATLSRKHPTGWEPGVDTAKGVIVAAPSDSADPPNDWADILAEFRLDPTKWAVDSDSVNVRTWDTNVGDGQITRLFYFKADVRPRTTANDADLEALMRRISKHRYRRPVTPATGGGGLVVCLADWQAGPDPEGLVDLVLALKGSVVDRLKAERPDTLYVIGMGDLIEGCDGHYPMQTFTTGAGGLNGRRDQVKLVRRLLVELVTEWARHVDRVVLSAVPGNHGENRKNGKAYTTFEDNDDLAVVEQVGEILAANPGAYGHVRTVLPDGDMSLTLDVAGTVVGFIHGHQATRGAGPRQRLDNWWKGKQSAKHPIGDADILVAGHLHHLVVVQDGPRTIMQCPALAFSRWFTERGGAETKPGTLTFSTSALGWDRMMIL